MISRQKTQPQQPQELQTADPMTKFMYALKAKESKRQYPRRFKTFLDFLGLEGTINEQAKQFLENTKTNPQSTEERFMDFIFFQLQRVSRGEIVESTIKNYYRPTKLFCDMNGCAQLVNWKMISRGIPRGRQAANDRAPTMEEIQKLIQYPDRRIKAIVSTMVSSGIRIGAWDYFRWKHVLPMTNDKDETVVAKLIVYAGDAEEYYTFITPEAYRLLKDWIDFRASYGERITGESWVMRDIWQTTNITYGANLGLATFPKKLKSSGIKRLLERALWEQHVRHPLENGAKRHEWKAAHGFRKFYKSRAEQMMKPINVEKTMGHNIGVSQSYYKPTEREVMEDYLKAVPLLTIEADKLILQKQVEELSEKTNNNDYLLKAKLQEKDDALTTLSDQVMKLMQEMQELKKQNKMVE
jgi:integrase